MPARIEETARNGAAARVAAFFARLGNTLDPAERKLFGAVLLTGFATVMLTLWRQQRVDWPAFGVGILASGALSCLGLYAREWRRAPKVGLFAISLGLFMGFSTLIAIFIFTLFPLTNPLIDMQLRQIDSRLGYDWESFVAWLGQWPWLLQGLGYLYSSSLIQMVALLAVLSAGASETQIRRFLAAGMASMCLSIAIWWNWPSIGPSAVLSPGADVALLTQMQISPATGAYFTRLVEEGLPLITPAHISGVVAFPSYHIVMALLVTCYAWRSIAFLPLLLLNLPMIPATLAHGGHHLVDLFGGAAVFLACAALASRLIPETMRSDEGRL